MKYKVHIPTEQFGFIEVEFEPSEGRNIEDVYYEVQQRFKPREGVEDGVMDLFVENMILGKGNMVEAYESMSMQQKTEVQRLKRAIKRIKARTNK